MNEEKNIEQQITPEDNTQDYIAEIEALRAGTVSKDDYNKLRDENRKLISALSKGEVISAPAQKTNLKDDINALAKKLTDGELSNLEYCKASIELRDKMIEAGENDPYLPFGHKIAPTSSDIEAANRVAETLKECIEYADGDSQLFTAELQRRTADAVPARRK